MGGPRSTQTQIDLMANTLKGITFLFPIGSSVTKNMMNTRTRRIPISQGGDFPHSWKSAKLAISAKGLPNHFMCMPSQGNEDFYSSSLGKIVEQVTHEQCDLLQKYVEMAHDYDDNSDGLQAVAFVYLALIVVWGATKSD